MKLDERLISQYARGRDWYLTLEHGTGKVLVVFRAKSMETKDADEFKFTERKTA